MRNRPRLTGHYITTDRYMKEFYRKKKLQQMIAALCYVGAGAVATLFIMWVLG
jgi:hypothetical protein